MFTSAIYMREHYRIPVLIVEGKVNYEYSMMDPQAVRGALSSMLLLYGIHVISTPDAKETAELILMMTRQEQVGIPGISLIPKRKATSLDDMQRRMIEMLPGCGMVMARDLLQHFGSVHRIVTATKDDLHSMRGIGAKKAKDMHDVISAEYKSVDTERNLEDAIEAEPKLLFRKAITLLARQHHIYTEEKERHIVDLVFVAKKSRELILVELKRGVLSKSDYVQICRYMDNAHKSTVLNEYLDKGFKLRGMLATIEKGDIKIDRKDVTTRIVDRRRVVKVLGRLRKERMGE